MLRITSYAERLVDDLAYLDWSEGIKQLQRDWIGRSAGAEVDFYVGPATEFAYLDRRAAGSRVSRHSRDADVLPRLHDSSRYVVRATVHGVSLPSILCSIHSPQPTIGGGPGVLRRKHR